MIYDTIFTVLTLTVYSYYISLQGEGCGQADRPGVYSRISAVADWIDQEICRMSCFPPEGCDPNVVHPCANRQQQNGIISSAMEQGDLSLQVRVTVDDYPSEVGIILEYLGDNNNATDADLLLSRATELWYYPYGSYSRVDDGSVIEKTFNNLMAGIYRFVLGDSASDGLCWYVHQNTILTISIVYETTLLS
jgi:hypothetical protein